MKKVSIIVPVHNTEKYIEKCINSILNQTYKYFELILIDDNSTDSSPFILEKYKDLDNRIIVRHVCAGSAGKTRNYGLKEANGFYLAFIDSDDWVEPTYLEDLITEIEENDCDCAMCGVSLHYQDGITKERVMREDSNIISGKDMRNRTLISILPNNEPCPTFYLWDKIYKRSLWKNIIFDPDLSNAEDRLALYTMFNDNVRTAITTKLLYNYRRGIGITSHVEETNRYDDYTVGYKMLEIAKDKNYDLSPVYENIVSHTLGKARRLITKRNSTQYYELACEFKRLYPCCKNIISTAQIKYKIPSLILRYFPKSLYWGYILLKKINSVLRKN